ncbi:DUF6647 family protein [Nitratireductor thuwali]|uniref:DUF6647 domain-containing protein n=1 Tax=Nitratireductor thuwali TaxID=2267699 RepID=A0ABY5MGV3_9HYPH|nr:hypothetical protein NTH_00890 [Nitratireductor thuwali]
MNELVVAVSLWLSALYGLPEMEAPPRVRFLEPRQVAAVRYGRADIVHADEVVAVYEPLTRTIVLSDRWRADDVADLSVLVHELVHHLQRQVGAEHRCPEEGEALAYEAQERWLGQFGTSLEAAFGIDAFTLAMRTKCLW